VTQPEVDQAAFEIIAATVEANLPGEQDLMSETFIAEAVVNALARAGYTIKRKDDPA
jgi:hypothetical protein